MWGTFSDHNLLKHRNAAVDHLNRFTEFIKGNLKESERFLIWNEFKPFCAVLQDIACETLPRLYFQLELVWADVDSPATQTGFGFSVSVTLQKYL